MEPDLEHQFEGSGDRAQTGGAGRPDETRRRTQGDLVDWGSVKERFIFRRYPVEILDGAGFQGTRSNKELGLEAQIGSYS